MLSKECHEETTFSFSADAPKPLERRRNPRHMTILRVGALIGPAGRELCLIRNISAGGLMAHVYSHHVSGEEVSVELKGDRRIDGSIIWINESNVGVQFHTPVDLAELLSSQALTENGRRPRMPRVEVDRLATVRVGARVAGANTRDISQGGVKIETDEPLEVHSEVVLTLEKFRPVQGVVRWCTDGLAGIAFNQPLAFGELMGWLTPGQRPKGV